ncbi:50S ribosomal protein L25/general stress protein Ctc [Streptantibioticus rubrisoli]|uniref:Large ribosomal subunit protein bL25 n=1 Tax=Streptantibioticus rubrisoli TaxID=1387313 RepID=A0ABT1PG84_9ACTN|nr:50S ribosomal protein L25/general stress protein Ctc [Streptantibioticus rubrisoli]MCQ4044364.1 50S ribosomal protein L25/general stress protein Ctc [Streptantibioticus rubrisoli]
MAEVRLSAELRNEYGKGAARRARRENKVPAVVYGHGAEPRHVLIDSHELMMALKTPNVLINLDIEGKKQLVIPKSVQREAVRRFLVHVDLLEVKRGEKVTVEVPIQTEGDLAPGGNLIEHLLDALPVEAEATAIPETLTVSIAGLDAGHAIYAKDVPLPKGTALAVDGDTALLQVVAAQAEEVPEEEVAAEEAAEAPAPPEAE